jgi:hypothetical protein
MSLVKAQLYTAMDPVPRKYYGLGRDEQKMKAQFSQIAEESTTDEPTREFTEFGGPQNLSFKAENAAMTIRTIQAGPVKRVSAATFAAALEISYEAVRDSKYKAIASSAKALGRATEKTPERLFAQFLDRSHDTAYPVTADGLPLFSASHVTPYGTTFSNTLSGAPALSETALEDVITALRTTIGPDGELSPVMFKQLIVPSSMSVLAEKLTTSPKTLGSNFNDPSVINGKKFMTFDYLTNTTRWIVQTDADNGFYWDWREKPQFERDNVALIMQAIYIAFFRAMWGAEDPRCAFSSNAV